jgi:LmbE family N-acetylglucosaminyl deacetylase
LPAAQYRRASGSPALKQQLEQLRVVGRVLLIAAHPDDENTALLAYCSQGRHLRTAYLSLTRGEGGQNLIGNEQGDLLGIIRTQELLSARRYDGAEQFFSRAVDFGFSKTADETLSKWGRQEILGDVVWMIRRFRPDVVIVRFSGTPRDGHGHHQASSMLGQKAFKLAGDPKAFPEQLGEVTVFQPKRLLWNGFAFNREQERELGSQPKSVMIDLGQYNPILGMGYGELAGLSRSQHRSQGMGSPERKGSAPNYFFTYAGDPATRDILDGVDTTWNRLAGGAPIAKALDEAVAAYSIDAPERVIPTLLKARQLIAAHNSPEAREKLVELDEALVLASGLWLEVNATRAQATPGGTVGLSLSAVARGRTPIRLEGVSLEGIPGAPSFPGAALEPDKPLTAQADLRIPADQPLSQPLQLRASRSGDHYEVARRADIGPAEAQPTLRARFRCSIDGQPFEVVSPVENRYVDRVRGELTQPFVIVPPVSLQLADGVLVFPTAKPRVITVEAAATVGAAAGSVTLKAPLGWTVTPAEAAFTLADAGQAARLQFTVTPPQAASTGEIQASAQVGSATWSNQLIRLNYEHIPPQTILRPATAKLLRDDIRITARRVGYIMGAGDSVPAALTELGCEVTMLDASDLARGDLARFDAIVEGVRAWSVRPDLRANYFRLQQYMEQGGTVVAQYNVLEGGPMGGANPSLFEHLGPWPIQLGRDRTTVEEAPVKILAPNHPLMTAPNRITANDFDGWTQERALYFPTQWDPRYQTVLETADPGEPAHPSGLLYTRVGKGAFIYTTYVWFRELPAGVPGAYRIFANLVSAGR